MELDLEHWLIRVNGSRSGSRGPSSDLNKIFVGAILVKFKDNEGGIVEERVVDGGNVQEARHGQDVGVMLGQGRGVRERVQMGQIPRSKAHSSAGSGWPPHRPFGRQFGQSANLQRKGFQGLDLQYARIFEISSGGILVILAMKLVNNFGI